MKEHMDRFPARFPPDLKAALAKKADSLPGTSMNDLVIAGVRHVVEGDALVVTTTGDVDAHEDLVILAISGEIGPAKGIARHYVETGRPNLGGLLYWYSSLMQDDSKAIATELVRSADQIGRRSRPIAKVLLRAALERNPASDVAKNRLGQILYREGDYAAAVELLGPIRDDDNYAKLAYGWAALELAGDDEHASTQALDEIVVALRRWALGYGGASSREQWLHQVSKLKGRRSEKFQQSVADLVSYANDNASWPPIALSEIKPPTKATQPEAPFGERQDEL